MGLIFCRNCHTGYQLGCEEKRLLMSINAEATEVGLCVSTQKTKTMETGENTVNTGTYVIEEEYKRVGNFLYLGCIVSAKGQLTKVAKSVHHFPIC